MIRFNYMQAPIASFGLGNMTADDVLGAGALAASGGLLAGGMYNLHRMKKYNEENPRDPEQLARGERFNAAVARADAAAESGPLGIKRYEFTPDEQEDMNAFMEYENSRAKQAGTINPFLAGAGVGVATAGALGAANAGAKYLRGRNGAGAAKPFSNLDEVMASVKNMPTM